jgi:negative regulator of flagellin synthesis FlgM
MAIEITGLTSSGTPTSSETSNVLVARTEPTVAQQATGGAQTAETVTLSDFAQQLRSLQQNLGSVPVVDTQRVEQVKQSLINGSYEFNSDRVAAKYLQFETRLAR